MVIGGSNFDIICKVDQPLSPNASTVTASIRTCFGGVARNLADALGTIHKLRRQNFDFLTSF